MRRTSLFLYISGFPLSSNNFIGTAYACLGVMSSLANCMYFFNSYCTSISFLDHKP